MINFGEFAAEVFQTLRAYGRELVLYDQDGNRVFEPKEARRFYISDDNILVSLSEDGDNSALKLYLSPSIELAQVSGFINTLQAMATRANLLFHVKKYDKEIKPQHFATSASLNEQEQPQMNIMEGMYGTSKSSYLKLESARMIVRHTASVNENMIGSRGRNIKAIFVENAQGERFRFPVNLLSGARAMTQHVNQGGTFADEVGQQIIRMAQDFRNLAQTAAHVRDNAKALPQEASSIRESVMHAMKSQKLSFARIYETRSYSRECARIVEAAQLNEAGEQIQEKLEALKGIFGESLDESVLTTVARLVSLPEAAPVTEDVNIEDHGQNSTAFKVMLNGEEIDTVFFGGGYTPEEVKASLINHDGYDPAIEVLPEGASCMEDEGGEDEGYSDSEGGDTDITDESMMSINDGDAYAAPKNPIIKQFEAWMNEFDPEQMLEGKSFKRGRDDDEDEDDDVDFKKKQEKKKRDERQSKKQPLDESKNIWVGDDVHPKWDPSGEAFKVIQMLNHRTALVVDEYGNKREMSIDDLIPVKTYHTPIDENETGDPVWYLVGNCVNSFDDDGECVIDTFTDASDFASVLEKSTPIDVSGIGKVAAPEDVDLTKLSFSMSEDNQILIGYDEETDVHYFFSKMDGRQDQAWIHGYRDEVGFNNESDGVVEGKSYKRDDDEDDDVDFKKKQEKKKRDERQSKKQGNPEIQEAASQMDDTMAAKKLFDKIKGTPNLKPSAVKQLIKPYLGMVGRTEKHLNLLAADVITMLQDAEMMEAQISDEQAAKKLFDKIKGTPNLKASSVKQLIKPYLGMVGRAEKHLNLLAADVITMLQDNGLMEGKTFKHDGDEDEGDSKQKRKEHKKQRDERRGKDEDLHEDVKASDEIANEIERLDLNVAPESRQAFDIFLNHNLSKFDPNNDLTIADAVKMMPVADAQKLLRDMKTRFKFEDSEMTEARVKSPDAEPDVTMYDIKSELYALKDKLSKTGVFDPEYRSLRARIDQLSHELKKVMPYGKAMQKGDMVEDVTDSDEDFDSNSDLEEDIQKGLRSNDPHARKMAQFAKNMQKESVNEFAEDPASKMQPGWYVKKNGMIGSGPFHSEEEAKNNSGDAPVAYWSGHDWMTNEDESMVPQDQSQDFEDDVTVDDPDLVPGMTEAARLAQLAGIKMKSIHDYIKQVILEGETLPSTEVAFGEGDQVKVIGDVLGHGKKGRIKMVAPSGMFSVVSFDDGTEASYHNSDIEHSLDDDEGDDEIDEEFSRLKKLAGMSEGANITEVYRDLEKKFNDLKALALHRGLNSVVSSLEPISSGNIWANCRVLERNIEVLEKALK